MDQPHISGKAVIITGGLLDNIHAKTAHGLLRGTKRFEILGVIDEKFGGRDAGEVVNGEHRNVPVESDIHTFISKYEKPKFAIVGMATKGGVLPKPLYPTVIAMLQAGIEIVNGLHEPFNEIQEFVQAAEPHGPIIHDIRKPKPFKDLSFWEGKIKDITATKIAVLGTDCALGKRTTSTMLETELRKKGINVHMIYTGQTGWMQGAGYGFFFDATPNDFICGELENSLYRCWKEEHAEVLIMEGQSGLRNPSGPCGSEFIISGKADGVVLQHAPARSRFSGLEDFPYDMPDILDEVEIIEKMGAPVIGLTLNESNMSPDEALLYREELELRTDLPILNPFKDSILPIVKAVQELRK